MSLLGIDVVPAVLLPFAGGRGRAIEPGMAGMLAAVEGAARDVGLDNVDPLRSSAEIFDGAASLLGAFGTLPALVTFVLPECCGSLGADGAGAVSAWWPAC